MIDYELHTLSNGLRVAVNRDRRSKLAALSILYKVGARDESPERTGFAHLFEHLMFRGTRRVPDFDAPVQLACGENNAFTNNDYTDFYMTLPTDNLPLAMWLEADRMTGLDIDAERLETEKRVVVEEFKERYLNRPYGDMTMLLRSLAYRVHPYRWATIGLSPEHIAGASLDEVRDFYRRHYRPSNAVLAVSADMEPERIFDMAETYFSDIADAGRQQKEPVPQEPPQCEARRMEVERDVPATVVTLAFHIGGRTSRDFFLGDLVSDLLAGGESSRLYNDLVKGRRLFSSVNAYVTGESDPGLFVFTGELQAGVESSQGEEAFWDEIARLQSEPAGDYELEKVRNKFEANAAFGELNVLNKALNLCIYDALGDITLINREVGIYRSLTAADIIEFSRRIFTRSSCSTLIYKSAVR